MKRIITVLMILTFLNACRASDEVYALEATGDTDLAWAFIQFNVPEDDGAVEAYYLYGRVSREMLARIANNDIAHGFIFLRTVRYWGNDDTIKAYRDGENTGDLIFRVEDVRRVKIIRNEPKVGMGYDEFTNMEEQPSAEAAPPTTTPQTATPGAANRI